jgi:hypothetical protein
MKKNIKILIQTVFLTLFSVFFAHWLSGVLGIEALAVNAWGWIALFVYYCIFVFAGLKLLERL